MTNDIKRQTLAILVDNESGVLSQISRLFSRKGYNIESLAVGATENPAISRITIEVIADDEQVALLANQLRKLFPVHSVKLLTPETSIRRELVLLKVRTPDSAARNEVIQIANIFRANIIDVAIGSITLSVIGAEQKTDAIEKILAEYGILELVRTGVVALERGQETIKDQTKEKGEFDYGKNVL
ncbi:MAG: acetolactate synthase small subunit [Ruminococcaceae bacterium]|nr:acetolactate synthase small subunit [Oscillospiraceae bacterium]